MNYSELINTLIEGEDFFLGVPWRLGEKTLAAVVPIRTKADIDRSYVLLSEVKDRVKFKDTGDINRVAIAGDYGGNVFFRTGTILKGVGTQDRVVVKGTIRVPNEGGEIPVRCVNAQRGIYRGSSFETMMSLSPSRVTSALRAGGQRAVWQAVAHSDTYAAGRVGYDPAMAPSQRVSLPRMIEQKATAGFSKMMEEAIKKIPDYEDQVGAVILTNKGVEGFEIFDSPESWRALGKEVIRSYGDLLKEDEEDLFALNEKAVLAKALSFLRRAMRATLTLVSGETYDVEYTPAGAPDEPGLPIVGEATLLGGSVMHVMLMVSRDRTSVSVQVNAGFNPWRDGRIREELAGDRTSDVDDGGFYPPTTSAPLRRISTTWSNVHDEFFDKKGSTLTLARIASEGPQTFTELVPKSGLARATLSSRLKEASSLGLIEKAQRASNGKTGYSLTAQGKECLKEKPLAAA